MIILITRFFRTQMVLMSFSISTQQQKVGQFFLGCILAMKSNAPPVWIVVALSLNWRFRPLCVISSDRLSLRNVLIIRTYSSFELFPMGAIEPIRSN